MKKMTKYDEHATKEIHAWKNPEIGWFGQAMKVINTPFDSAGNLILDTPGVGDVLKKSAEGLTSICSDAAHWSVRHDAIYAEFRESGHRDVHSHRDIDALRLEDIDKVVGWLAAKYKGIAAVEGAGTGFAGLPGIPIDIVALVTLNIRAIGEYATYYGFDVSRQEERLFAMNILGLASSPSDSSKIAAMAQLVKISKEVAVKKSWEQLEKSVFVKVIREIAKSLGVRITKAKLVQIIPGVGAAVGGGFNAYFTAKVCDAAYYLYRERFLANKYGGEVIEVTVEPADSYDPNYIDADEVPE